MNKFQQRSKIEREKFVNFITKAYGTSDMDVSYTFTDDAGFEVYDVHLQLTNRKTHKLTDVIVEIKVREKDYPTWILEKKKYDSLMLKSLEYDADVWYLNFTPEKTYLFDLTNIEFEDSDWVESDLVWHTCKEEDGVISKVVTYLDPSLSSI